MTLETLMNGNVRFVAGKLLHPHQDASRRQEIAPKQHPVAIVVSCSDSRVPPEIVFDLGLGDLFVIRVAGNVLDDAGIGSIEYAAEHLKVPLVVVLGHKNCGAVSAAVGGGHAMGHIGSVVEAIAPAVDEAKKGCSCKEGDLVEAAGRANVELVVKTLKNSVPILSHLVNEGKLSVVGAYYDMDSGKVELL